MESQAAVNALLTCAWSLVNLAWDWSFVQSLVTEEEEEEQEEGYWGKQ